MATLIVASDGQHLFADIPLLVVCFFAIIRPAVSPKIIAAAGVGAFLLLFALEIDWTILNMFYAAMLVTSITLISLLFSEHNLRFLHSEKEGNLDPENLSIAPKDLSQFIIARELRRCRRSNTPLSLVSFTLDEGISEQKLNQFIQIVRSHSREFDVLCWQSSGVLCVLCPNTHKRDAEIYACRIQSSFDCCSFNLVTFPVDAVTSNGLIDAIQQPSQSVREVS